MSRRKTRFAALLGALLSAAALATFTTPALAHTDEYLDTVKTPHGGQLRMAGVYHLELVVAQDGKARAGKPLTVYVTDHAGNKVAVAGATGAATIISGGKKSTVELKPAGDNVLAGKADYAATPDLAVIVSVTLPGADMQQARFTPVRSGR